MKVIFFAGTPIHNVKDLTMDAITGTGALYNYFLRKEFDKMGIETDYCYSSKGGATDEKLNTIEVPSGDHILSVAQRGFSVRCRPTNNLLANVRKSIKGKITSICDHVIKNPTEDIIFHSLPHPQQLKKNVHIGWAADRNILYPQQDPTKLRILIDHAYYGKNHLDYTEKISRECLDFQKIYTEKELIIRRFSGAEGCETVTENNWRCGEYNRATSMQYPKACEEYRKSDIFIVTHPESLGLSVVESASCGSFIVCPSGHIKSNVLNYVKCLTYKDKVPFESIIKRINIEESLKRTENHSWQIMAEKIIKELKA